MILELQKKSPAPAVGIQEILHMTHVDRIVKFSPTAEAASKNFGSV